MNYIATVMMVWGIGEGICDLFLQQKVVQDLIHSSDQEFDLIVTEAFSNDCVLGFAHKFKAPIVQIVSFGGSSWMGDWVGNPNPYSYVPDFLQNFSDRMDLWERTLNTLGNTFQKLTRHLCFIPRQQDLLEKYFSGYAPLPSISDLDSSTSLILVNHHFSISYPRPLVPNIVQVGGMHIKPAKKLPEVSITGFRRVSLVIQCNEQAQITGVLKYCFCI
jgi:glucuronosyltransferase